MTLMKLNSRYAVLAATLASIGLGTVVAAQDASSTSSSSASAVTGKAHWHHMRGAGPVAALLRATHQLNLSSDQKQSIRTLLSQARSQHRGTSGAPDITVLGNPGDANYGTAVQSLQSREAGRIQQQSELASSIYNVLTPEQKQQLPTVLANIKAQAQQRRAAWQAQHAGASSTPAN
jgi:Spy/CpxP family protein refolding chaperone